MTTYNKIKGFTKKAWLKAIINKWRDSSHHHIVKVKPGLQTACWFFANDKHHVFIGDGWVDNVKGDLQLYVESLLCHELGHGLYTQKDVKGVFAQAKCMGVSKYLLNLAEDVRIENLFREFSERRFNWTILEEFACTGSPESLLLSIKSLEGAWPLVNESQVPVLGLIDSFYQRFQACATTEDLIPILVEWNEVFHSDSDDESSQNGDSQCDDSSDFSDELKESIKESKACEPLDLEDINDVGGDFDAMDEGSIAVIDTYAEKQGNLDVENPEISENKDSFAQLDSTSGFYLACSEPVDLILVNKLSKQCASAFKVNSAYVATNKPSKRLNIRGIVRGDYENIYRAKESLAKSNLKTNLIIDCSGSMRGEPIDNARTIIAVFSTLAKQGYVQGNVILSKSGYVNEVLQMPLKPSDIGLIARVSSDEGLQQTFDNNLNLLSDAKINFIVTDGNICDGDLDKRYYSRKGINTFGLYVGENSDDGNLLRWFNRGVARQTIESLIAVMVRNLKSKI